MEEKKIGSSFFSFFVGTNLYVINNYMLKVICCITKEQIKEYALPKPTSFFFICVFCIFIGRCKNSLH